MVLLSVINPLEVLNLESNYRKSINSETVKFIKNVKTGSPTRRTFIKVIIQDKDVIKNVARTKFSCLFRDLVWQLIFFSFRFS